MLSATIYSSRLPFHEQTAEARQETSTPSSFPTPLTIDLSVQATHTWQSPTSSSLPQPKPPSPLPATEKVCLKCRHDCGPPHQWYRGKQTAFPTEQEVLHNNRPLLPTCGQLPFPSCAQSHLFHVLAQLPLVLWLLSMRFPC